MHTGIVKYGNMGFYIYATKLQPSNDGCLNEFIQIQTPKWMPVFKSPIVVRVNMDLSIRFAFEKSSDANRR
jgi:hypothetical protein